MVLAFGHYVEMCCDMLGIVGSSLKMVKFESTTPNTSQHGGQCKRTQHAAPNNFAIRCVCMLRSFGRGFGPHVGHSVLTICCCIKANMAKVCIRPEWPIRAEPFLVSVA